MTALLRLHGDVGRTAYSLHPSHPQRSPCRRKATLYASELAASWTRTLLCYSILFLTCSVGALSQPGPSGSWQIQEFSGALSLERTFPRIDNGYVFSFRPTIQGGSSDDVVLSSAVTGGKYQFSFSLPGMSEIHISDMSVDPSGQIYVVGSSLKPKDATLTNFLAKVDLSGRITSLSLKTYRPQRVCTAKDGTLWMLGEVLTEEPADNPVGMLRNYSTEGRLRAAYLSHFDFPVVSRNLAKRSQIFLSCGEESVGAYLGPARLWVEIPYGDSPAEQSKVQPPLSTAMTRLVLIHKGEVFATFRDRDSQGRLSVFNTLYRLTLNQSTPGWRRISGMAPASETPLKALLGRDGPYLVYVGNSNSDQHLTMNWSKP